MIYHVLRYHAHRVTPNEANLGGKTGFIFGGLCAIGTVWGYFYIPETKNRTVDESVDLVDL